MSETGGGRRRLSSPDIVRAAIALIDAEGPANLTMRRLGTALGVEAMALYRYFPSRRALLDALIEQAVSDTATDPELQLVAGDSWEDYLDRLAHGVRRMALTHPRVFPLIATHPTEAPWLRPPIRSVRWVEAFLAGLQDHQFPPVAAVTAYKRFSTFLLGHLLLEVAALGLDHDDTATAPPAPPDRDHRIAERQRRERAEVADVLLTGPDAPDADDIVEAATTHRLTVADEPAVLAADPGVALATAAGTFSADGAAEVAGASEVRRIAEVDAVAVEADVPVVAALVSTESVDLGNYPQVAAMAGLLARDTAAADFDDDLAQVIDGLARLRRP